jgi:glutamine amidotransferase
MITIVDYGMGNLGSIRNMLRKVGVESQISADPAVIAAADKLILPGVGAFDAGMTNLRSSGLQSVLDERVRTTRVPTLGICLGMQLMANGSEEGNCAGLGWIDANVLRFNPTDHALKVPHMGWNLVTPVRTEALVDRLPSESRFYFVHSYYVRCREESDVLMTTHYSQTFHSAFQRGNLWGVQFHPEKSHRYGMQLLRNFAVHCAVDKC